MRPPRVFFIPCHLLPDSSSLSASIARTVPLRLLNDGGIRTSSTAGAYRHAFSKGLL
jgi:hypothetical protein